MDLDLALPANLSPAEFTDQYLQVRLHHGTMPEVLCYWAHRVEMLLCEVGYPYARIWWWTRGSPENGWKREWISNVRYGGEPVDVGWARRNYGIVPMDVFDKAAELAGPYPL